jgi:DNA-binding NarL/FixJ family response regulator
MFANIKDREMLTQRESQVYQAYGQYGGNREAIAEALGIKPSTVKTHLDNGREKARKQSTVEAYLEFLKTGLLPFSSDAEGTKPLVQ